MHSSFNFKDLLNINWNNVPDEVKDYTTLLLIDFIGSTLGGLQTEAAKLAQKYVKHNYGDGNSTVFSPGLNTASLFGAVYANSTFASALDIDDGYRLAAGHPGSSVIPVAMAVSKQLKVSGKEFLTSMIIGYEIATRTGREMYRNSEGRFFGSGGWASSGAAAAASYLYHLSEEKFIQSLGVTEAYTPLSPNLKSIENGSMVKESIGWGAVTGLNGALLAREGFTGVVPKIVEVSSDTILEGLGSNFLILNTYLKPYACCRWIQPSLEGLKKLKQEHSLEPDQVTNIRIDAFEKALTLFNPEPKTSVAAQYSLPFIVAAYFYDNQVGPRQVSKQALERKEITGLAAKVDLKVNDEIERRFPKECLSKIIVVTKGGSVYDSGIMGSPGTPENPLGREKVVEKFRWLSGGVLSHGQQDDLLNSLNNMENQPFSDFIETTKTTISH